MAYQIMFGNFLTRGAGLDTANAKNISMFQGFSKPALRRDRKRVKNICTRNRMPWSYKLYETCNKYSVTEMSKDRHDIY